MKFKHIFLTITALFIAAFAYGQSAVDSTITLVIPTKVDLTTTSGIQQFVGYVVMMIITLIGGFWAKGKTFLDKYLNTTEKKVAFTGFILTLVAGFVTGFTKDIVSALLISALTVFSTMGIFGTLKPVIIKTDEVLLPPKTDA